MKKEISQELKELESSLVNHKKTELFKVNDDYFANMQKSVLSKMDQQSKNSKVVKVFNLKRILAIAAIFIVLIDSRDPSSQAIPMISLYPAPTSCSLYRARPPE